jgi:hypothetical protein
MNDLQRKKGISPEAPFLSKRNITLAEDTLAHRSTTSLEPRKSSTLFLPTILARRSRALCNGTLTFSTGEATATLNAAAVLHLQMRWFAQLGGVITLRQSGFFLKINRQRTTQTA